MSHESCLKGDASMPYTTGYLRSGKILCYQISSGEMEKFKAMQEGEEQLPLNNDFRPKNNGNYIFNQTY
jgi:hypothetical protein